MSEIVGVSLTDVTVNTKVSLAVPPFASVRVTVIVVVPDWLAAGVTVTVRLAPLPPKVMFAFGTSVVLDEVPDRVKLRRRGFRVTDGEGDGGCRGVFVGGLVGDVRDRRVVVNCRDCQHKGVAAVPPSASVTVTVIVAVPN